MIASRISQILCYTIENVTTRGGWDDFLGKHELFYLWEMMARRLDENAETLEETPIFNSLPNLSTLIEFVMTDKTRRISKIVDTDWNKI